MQGKRKTAFISGTSSGLGERTLSRDTSSLTSREFDVLVIGGGINGACIAWDARQRGFDVALIEKGDFGQGASQGCFKIVHGGLRYLQHGDIGRLRESVREQRTLRHIAPHLVHPMPFLVPCYGYGMRGKEVLSLGVMLYELLASNRNELVSDYHRLPSFKILNKEQCLSLAPGLNAAGLRGAVIYYDCQMSNCERLTLSFVKAAAFSGAVVCNYVAATELETEASGNVVKREIKRVVCRDMLNGRTLDIRAKCIVNAAGPWSHVVCDFVSGGRAKSDSCRSVGFSKGVQVVVPQVIAQYSLALESMYRDTAALIARGGRSYFIAPWRGHSLIGTYDEFYTKHPDEFRIEANELSEFISDVKSMYSSRAISERNISFAFGGLRPLDESRVNTEQFETPGQVKSPAVARKDSIVDHSAIVGDGAANNVNNLVSVIGVKYTTARAVAEKVVDLVAKKLNANCAPCRTSETVLPGGVGFGPSAIGDDESEAREFGVIAPKMYRQLALDYGAEMKNILELAASDKSLAEEMVTPYSSAILAEVIHVVRNEMACRLSDVVLRRTGLGTLGKPDDSSLSRIVQIMAAELGWDRLRCEEELAATKAAYQFN